MAEQETLDQIARLINALSDEDLNEANKLGSSNSRSPRGKTSR